MRYLLFPVFAILLYSCQSTENNTATEPATTQADSTNKVSIDSASKTSDVIADAATIMARKQVPILCYHHIRPGVAKNLYEVTVEKFKDQMKTLHDSGYKTVLPEQVYDYLTKGTPLPEKPVMITYDDTDEEQFSIAKPEMDKYGFKGVYFLMTISIGRPRYMSKEQIKQLADEGHAVECHTWDHNRVDRYTGEDWDKQLVKPRKTIEDITGKPVRYFAYPFGIWAPTAFPELESRNYKLAFQLSTKRDSLQPLYTVRRIIVAPQWTGPGLLKVMKSSFK